MKNLSKKAASLILSLCMGAAVIPTAAAELNEIPAIGDSVLLPQLPDDETVFVNDGFTSELTGSYTWSTTAGYSYLADDGVSYLAMVDPSTTLTLNFPVGTAFTDYTVQFNAYVDYSSGDCTKLIKLGSESTDAFDGNLIVTDSGLEFTNNSAAIDKSCSAVIAGGWHCFKIDVVDATANIYLDGEQVITASGFTSQLTYLAVSPGSSTVLLDNFILSGTAGTVVDEYTIPSGITVSAPAKDESVIYDADKDFTFGTDFEDSVPMFYNVVSGTERSTWSPAPVEGVSNKVNVISGYSLARVDNWLNNYTLKYNMKLNYDSSVQNKMNIANLGTQYTNMYYDAIILSNDPASDSGTISYRRVVDWDYNSQYDTVVTIDNFAEIFDGKWCYVEISYCDGQINVAVNGTTYLSVAGGFPSGEIGMNPTGYQASPVTMYLDNYYVVKKLEKDENVIDDGITIAAPAEDEQIIYDAEKNITFGTDFEDSVPMFYNVSGSDRSTWTPTAIAGTINKVSVVSGYSLASVDNWFKNFTLKYNMRLDYDPSVQNKMNIANLGTQYINMYYDAIVLSNDPSSNSGTISYRRVVDWDYDSQYDTVVTIDNFAEIFQNKWCYVEIGYYNGQITVSVNGTTYLSVTGGFPSGEIGMNPTGYQSSPVNMYLDNYYVVKKIEKDYTVIDNGVTLAEVNAADDVIMHNDFEDGTTPFDGSEIVDNGSGNKVIKISTEAKLPQTNGNPNSWLSNYKLKYNMLLNYSTAVDNGIVLLQTREAWWGAQRVDIKLYVDAGADNGTIVVETKYGDNSATLPEIPFENCNEILNGKWVYVESVLDGTNITYSINGTKLVDVSLEGYDSPSSGGMGFAPNCDMYIDNFIMYNIKPLFVLPDVVPVPEYNGSDYIIMKQDYEDIASVDELSGMGWAEIYSSSAGIETDTGINDDSANKVFNASGDFITRDLHLGSNYTIEFNAKIDYTTSACWPEFSWNRSYTSGENRYKLYLGYQDGSQQGLVKIVNGSETWIDAKTIPYAKADKQWAYFKIERIGNTFNIYFDSKTEPTITFTDDSPLTSGGFRIGSSGAASMLIDNLLITTPELPKQLAVSGSYETSGNTVTCTLSISNNYTATVTPRVIIAAYDETGKLITAQTKDIEVAAGTDTGATATVTTADVSLTVADPAAYTYKTFVWNSSDNSPYCNVLQ